jgi:hypothetical protein
MVYPKPNLLIFRTEKLAAKRLTEYWEKRLEVFGPEKAFLPLHLDKALKDDMVAVDMGVLRLLPVKADPGGRSSLFLDPSRQDLSKYTRESMIRVYWYLFHVALEDQDTQKKGLVLIGFPKNAKFSQFDRTLVKMMMRSVKGQLPVRLAAIHMCHPPAAFQVIFPFLKILLGERLRKRFKVHGGSEEKVLERLAQFGLERTNLPTELGGQIVLDHEGWLEDRKLDET